MIHDALDTMILSSSGWRKIFAQDGENGINPSVKEADLLLAVGMGLNWSRWLENHFQRPATVLVGTDTRPTGPALAGMIIAGLESGGSSVHYAGTAAAPEIMARCKKDERIDAFAFVSASHNPVGHNGVKFGLDGAVIGGNDARQLIAEFHTMINDVQAEANLRQIARKAQPRSADAAEKAECLRVYKAFLEEIAGGPEGSRNGPDTLTVLHQALHEQPIRIIADLNGSARCVSVDRDYLCGLGVALETFNDNAGDIAHQILPEGMALEPCRLALEKAHKTDHSALIGYVPDNDGDRGNLVIWDESIGTARSLEAQEVFAITVLAEFAAAKWASGTSARGGSALVVNGPTSHRVRDIATLYGAEVHEAEVGEANQVNRAAELRQQGYQVRLLGEGSNGGAITHPATVRDPLNTISALLKLLRLPAGQGQLNPFEDWCRLRGIPYCGDSYGPADILASLPQFTTTAASAERAVISIETTDQGRFKTEWESLFLHQYSRHKEKLAEEYGFTEWIELNNEGTTSRNGMGSQVRSGKQSGGLKILFRNRIGEDAGFLWMRGSGTEPVFRVMTEIRGDRLEAERKLTNWHRGMVRAADRKACGSSQSCSIPDPV